MNTPVPAPEPHAAPEAHRVSVSVITVEDAKAVLYWQGSRYGSDPGLFMWRLLRTVISADEANAAKLRREYPGLVAAVESFRRDVNWLEKLEAIVRDAEVSE